MPSIYGLAHPITGEVRYVGQTRGPIEKRLTGHIGAARNGNDSQRYLHRWIRKVERETKLTPNVILLEECDANELNVNERKWIAHFGSRLTNMTSGGDFTAGRRNTPHEALVRGGKTAGKMLKGRPKTAEHRAKLSASLTGRKRGTPSEDTRRKIGHANSGSSCTCRSNRVCGYCRNVMGGEQS